MTKFHSYDHINCNSLLQRGIINVLGECVTSIYLPTLGTYIKAKQIHKLILFSWSFISPIAQILMIITATQRIYILNVSLILKLSVCGSLPIASSLVFDIGSMVILVTIKNLTAREQELASQNVLQFLDDLHHQHHDDYDEIHLVSDELHRLRNLVVESCCYEELYQLLPIHYLLPQCTPLLSMTNHTLACMHQQTHVDRISPIPMKQKSITLSLI